MPRPRKNDPTPLIRPILLDFAREIAGAVERLTLDRVREVLDGARVTGGRGGRGGRRGPRSAALCYYPGCKNTAAPRYGMFCVALHKNLSVAEKEKHRKAHAAGGAKLAAAKRSKKK
jgi:hypothetical protein